MSFGSAELLGGAAEAALRRDPAKTAQALGGAGGAAADQLRAQAAEFEKVFLAEMLKNAGLDDAVASTDSGFGADAYRSFLVDAYAGALAEQQSFGLAEALYDDLRHRISAETARGGASDVA